MQENIIVIKSKAFAIRIVRLYQFLTTEKKEFVMSKQLLRKWHQCWGEYQRKCLWAK